MKIPYTIVVRDPITGADYQAKGSTVKDAITNLVRDHNLNPRMAVSRGVTVRRMHHHP